MSTYEYRIITSTHTEFEIIMYGISVLQRQGNRTSEVYRVENITPNQTSLAHLIKQCQQLQLAPIHLMDVIEDFLLS